MEPTYSGFKAPTTIDWGALSNKMAETSLQIGKDREAAKVELDKIASDNINKMNEIAQGNNQTFGTMILNFQNDGKNMVNELNKQLKAGEMSPSEYRKRLANLNDNTLIMAGAAKTMDARIEEITKRQQDGVASTWELELLKEFGSLTEINNAKFHVSDNGSVMYSKIDPTTGDILGELKDVRTMNLPQNIQDNKVVLDESVANLTDKWNPYEIFKDTGGGGAVTISSVSQQPVYKGMKAKVAVALTSTPRSALSVLADNGGMNPVFYYTEDEKNKARQSLKAEMLEENKIAGIKGGLTKEQLDSIEFNLVKKKREPDGTYNPELTEKQMTAARELAMQAVDIQMERKMSGSSRQPRSSGGGSGSGSGREKEPDRFDTYAEIRQAFDMSGRDPKRAAQLLTNSSGGRYYFEWGSKGLNAYAFKEDGTPDKTNKIIDGARSGEEIANIMYGLSDASGVNKSIERYNIEKDLYNRARGGNTINMSKY
jgi:hypothetical protein